MWVPPDPVPPGVAHMTSLVTFALALRLAKACLPSLTWADLRADALARPGIMASRREAAHPVVTYHGRLRARLPGCELVASRVLVPWLSAPLTARTSALP